MLSLRLIEVKIINYKLKSNVCLGLDDTFVVLNSWQHTDRKASVSERMGVCLAEVKK